MEAGETLTVGINGGFIVTLLVTIADGPLHPFAVTRILTDPENPFAQVITPKEFILPAAPLLKDQFNPVLFVAVVAYVVVVVPLVN